MMYGMSYDEFWHGDPWLAYYYREAYIARRKDENYRDWLQGAYFYNAVATALSNAFRKKGTKTHDYLREPFQIFPPTAQEKQAKLEKEKRAAEAFMMQIAAQQHAKKTSQEPINNGETGTT